jgi:hypothetical protein
VNILNIDLEQINKKIYEYIGTNSEMPYIVCNDETEKIIIAKCYENRLIIRLDRYSKCRDTITQYYGCTILNDNSLKLGEIKIR